MRKRLKIIMVWSFNFPDKLYRGWDKKEEVGEISHEDETDSKFYL